MLQSNFNNSLCNRQSMGYGEDFYFNMQVQSGASEFRTTLSKGEKNPAMQQIALGGNNSKLDLTCSNSVVNNEVQFGASQHIPVSKEENIKYNNTNTIEWYMLEHKQRIALRNEVTESGMFNYLSSHIGTYQYFDSTPIDWEDRDWIVKPSNYIKINRYRNRKIYKPSDIETQKKFILTWCVLRWRMKPTISYIEMVCNAITDALRYFKAMDEKAITAEIAHTAYRVMNNPHKFDYLTADTDKDEREYITNPNLTNRRQISNRARHELKRANRNLISTHSDQQNATRLNVSKWTVQRQRKANNGLSTYEQREQLISTWYNPDNTDKENLTLINIKGNGINVSLRTLQNWKRKHGYSRKTLITSPEPHQTFNTHQPIQITTDMVKDDQRADIKATNLTESDRSNLIETPQPPTRVFTEEEQKLMDDFDKRYKDHYTALCAQDDEESTEDEKDDCGATGEVWDTIEESETWGAVCCEGLKEEYKYMFKDILTAVADEDIYEFNDLFNNFLVELTEYCYEDDERKLERVMNVLLDEMEGLGHDVERMRDELRYRNQYQMAI